MSHVRTPTHARVNMYIYIYTHERRLKAMSSRGGLQFQYNSSEFVTVFLVSAFETPLSQSGSRVSHYPYALLSR